MIEISKLTKTYDRGTKALKDVNITIDDGEFVFITGRSGSGKSTLIKILLKEVEPTSGRVVVNDMDLRKMPRRYVPKYRRRLGVVFQDFRLLKDKTVYENVAFAQRVIGESSRTIRESVPHMLKMVGLSSKYKFDQKYYYCDAYNYIAEYYKECYASCPYNNRYNNSYKYQRCY